MMIGANIETAAEQVIGADYPPVCLSSTFYSVSEGCSLPAGSRSIPSLGIFA